jgi:hypothetical protein
MKRWIVVWSSVALTLASAVVVLLLLPQAGGFTLDDLSGIIFVSGITVVGCLVLVRQPSNRQGWLFVGIGTLWAVSGATLTALDYQVQTGGQMKPWLPWLALGGSWTSDLAWVTSVTFMFLLFPDGRLPSPRWRWVAWLVGGFIGIALVLLLLAPGPLSQVPSLTNPLGLAALEGAGEMLDRLLLAFVGCVLLCLASVFLRYRGAGAQVRRQIKWVAYYGLMLAGLYLAQSLAASAQVPIVEHAFYVAGTLFYTAFPLVLGFAILRHQLFDIDLLIRRTLVYSVLTGVLALAYFGSVVALESVVRPLTGQSQSTLVTVVSTLVIAALFVPLRARVQAAIDRRFYRSKYDVATTLAAFALTLRDETDLDRLSSHLVGVVNRAMQPSGVNLWLMPRPPQSRGGER